MTMAKARNQEILGMQAPPVPPAGGQRDFMSTGESLFDRMSEPERVHGASHSRTGLDDTRLVGNGGTDDTAATAARLERLKQDAELQSKRLGNMYEDLHKEQRPAPAPALAPPLALQGAPPGTNPEAEKWWGLRCCLSSMTQSVADLESSRELFFPKLAWEDQAPSEAPSAGSNRGPDPDDAAPKSSWWCFGSPKGRKKKGVVERIDDGMEQEEHLDRIIGDGGGILPQPPPRSKPSPMEREVGYYDEPPATPQQRRQERGKPEEQNLEFFRAQQERMHSEIQQLLQMQREQSTQLLAQMSAVQQVGDEMNGELREQAKLYDYVLQKQDAMHGDVAKLTEQVKTLPGTSSVGGEDPSAPSGAGEAAGSSSSALPRTAP